MRGLRFIACGAAGLALGMCPAITRAGSLTPPAGPVAPTPGPEPRIAINATNTPGDADSVFKITAPGSYYLTGNVTGEPLKAGIAIESSGVSIDLMGFEVVGASPSFDGVYTTVAGLEGIEVRNGTITGWGGNAINFVSANTQGARVESIRAVLNSSSGIGVGTGTIIASCVADQNAAGGISTGAACTVTGCVARANNAHGIIVGSGSSVTDSLASGNGGAGITLGTASTAIGCSSYDSGTVGIQVGVSSVVSKCTAYSSGSDGINCSAGVRITECNSSTNTGDGIEVSNDSTVAYNSCDGNGSGATEGASIHVTGPDNRIEGNSCTDSDRGIDVDATGNIIVRNTCSGNTTNWDIAVGNAVAPIVIASTNAAAILGNTYAGSLSSTDPNANFSY